jgi:hypothetical protein
MLTNSVAELVADFILGWLVSSIWWIWFTRDWEDTSVKAWFDEGGSDGPGS